MSSEQLTGFILQLVTYGGGSAALAFVIFRYLGKSWIESKFAQNLEHFRYEQAKELERLKVEIDSVLSAKLKLQEREFELLPKAWSLLDEAYGSVASLVSPSRNLPRFGEMDVARLKEFVDGLGWSQTYKTQLMLAPEGERSAEYLKINFLYEVRDARVKCSDFHNFVIRDGIFFPSPLKQKLTAVADALWTAVGDKEMGQQCDQFDWEVRARERVESEIKPLYQSIEDEIHTRLHSHGVSKEK